MTPFTWNANQVDVAPGIRRTSFDVGWRNYLQSGLWLPTNTAVQADRTVTAFPGNVTFPVDSQGWANMVFDHNFSMKRKIDEGNTNNSEPELQLDMQVLAQHNVTGSVIDGEMHYLGAWDDADLIMRVRHGRAARIEKIVKINSMPSGTGDIQYQFKMTSSLAKVFVGPQFNQRPWQGNPSDNAQVNGSPIFIARGDSQLRGSLMKTPICWWFENGERQVRNVSVDFVIESDGETVTGTKNIPRAYVTEALAAGSALYTDATFTPDANPETTTVDGMAARTGQNATWASVTGGAGTFSTDTGSTESLGVQSTTTTDQYEYYRHIFFGFDTSSIGSGQQVDSASITLRRDNVRIGGTLGLSTDIYTSTPASNTALASGDYMSFGSTSLTGSPRVMEDESFDNPSVETTFDSNGEAAIQMEGVTNLGIGVTAAHESGSPTWASSHQALLRITLAENSGTADDPTLTVTHSAAGSAVPIFKHHYTQQRVK